jgi:Stage II sporulation protein E (SpoIIE)
MLRRTPLALSLAAFLVGGFLPAGQRSTAAQPDRAHVTLGQAAMPLFGPWKFTVGDSPIDPKTGKPLWAEPDFDDSKWENVDLTPMDGAVDPIAGLSGFVPGWTAKGHPGYLGYAWYRIRVQVQARPGLGLALAGPADVDDAYQVFDNGDLAGYFGDFTGKEAHGYYTQPKMFPMPLPGNHAGTERGGTGIDMHGMAASTLVLSFRVWMEPFTLINLPGAGGLHSAPVLGGATAVAAAYQERWLELIRSHASNAALALLFGLLAMVACTLILFDRSDRVYLWMGAFFLLIAVDFTLTVIGSWTEVMSMSTINLLRDALTHPLLSAAWVMVWRVWFGEQRPRWLPHLVAGLTIPLMLSTILEEEIIPGLVPLAVAHHFGIVSLVLRLLFFAFLLWVVVAGIRRQGVEGWLVLPVVLLHGVGASATQLNLLNGRISWFPFGVQISLVTIADLLMSAVIALLLLRRLLQSVKRQRLMALDVKQAQEVQQVILPEARMALPGLTVESEYRPAREVGGDFFQIIPHKSDGSLLIVAGDVTGKGLKAGMLVALLVGAVRSTAETNSDPEGILAALNRRLLGRSDAQATCVALRIGSDGRVTLANAGHMAPYLNGEPLPMEGALPLGMMEGAESSVMHFELKQGDRLMLMSDGVAEATDSNGHLFGFERVNELLRKATTAAQIAEAAQQFGQEDDISVIAVTRMEGNGCCMPRQTET